MDNCTIYSPVMDFEKVISIVNNFFDSDSVVISGSDAEWGSVKASTDNSVLIFNSKVRVSPGDDFSRLIMSTHTYLSKMPEREGKEAVLKFVLKTQWIIGVVSDPGFEENPSHEECVLKVCQELGGMVFNGHGMLDGSGDELLAPDLS